MFWRYRTSQRVGKMAVRGMTAAFASPSANGTRVADTTAPNPLRDYFESHKNGRGIWKWRHYFDIYHRHFQKFVGTGPHVLEIGIYSGGSLDMWQSYFGNGTQIYGVDIEEACKAYERDSIRVLIGDQQDRAFWNRVKSEVPKLDVVIDDGGHTAEQQIATLEELLPHLKAGGVFLCEDVHGNLNDFASYAAGLIHRLNADVGVVDATNGRYARTPSDFQQGVASIHFYPYVVVVERTSVPVQCFEAPKHGTEWQPFL